jgi:hypothetical protein
LTWIYFASFFLNYQFQIVGSFWYLLAVERNDFCWKKACSDNGYNKKFLYCGNQYMQGYSSWQNRSEAILTSQCSTDNDNPPFDYGIFTQALKSGIVSSNKFLSKYVYCLWWGLQNLRYLILLSLLIFISQFIWKHTKHSNTEIICSVWSKSRVSLVCDMPGLITWVVLAALSFQHFGSASRTSRIMTLPPAGAYMSYATRLDKISLDFYLTRWRYQLASH